MKALVPLLLIGLVVSCGKKNDNESVVSDNGLQKVKDQEAKLKSSYGYTFNSDSSVLNGLNCNESFLDSSVAYLDVASSYTEKVVNLKKYDNDVTRSVVKNYNVLLTDLNNLADSWSDCVSETALAQENITYISAIKAEVNYDRSKNDLINTLGEIAEYKNPLNRVLDAIEKGQNPNMQDVEKLHLYQQALYSKESKITNKDVQFLESHLDTIVDQLPAQINQKELGEFKVAYESVIEKRLNKKIQYNRAYFSVSSKILKGKTQCLGGTKTDLLLNLRAKGLAEYYNRRPVVILSKGHILPGFLTGYDKEWHLFGVESTFAGEGQVYYGNISDIADLDKKILVLDAYDYLYINSVQSYLVNPKEVVKQAVRQFAQKYSITNFEELYSKTGNLKSIKNKKQSLKSDIFAFGESSQKAGTYKRNTVRTNEKKPADILKNIKSKISEEKLSTKLSSITSKIDSFSTLSLPSTEVASRGEQLHLPPAHLEGALQIETVADGKYRCVPNNGGQIFSFEKDGTRIKVIDGDTKESVNFYRYDYKQLVGILPDQKTEVGMLLFPSREVLSPKYQQNHYGYYQKVYMLLYALNGLGHNSDQAPHAECRIQGW